MSEHECSNTKSELDWYSTSPLFSTSITYAPMRALIDDEVRSPDSRSIILFTGIADDSRIREFLEKDYDILHVMKYRDHHRYSRADIRKLKEICATFDGRQISLVTTAKDAVKLRSTTLKEEWVDMPIFYQPIELRFHKDGFDEMILGYARANKRDS